MKKRRRKTSYYIKQAAVYAVIILLALVCVIPLYWMVRSSFMKNNLGRTGTPDSHKDDGRENASFSPEELALGQVQELKNRVEKAEIRVHQKEPHKARGNCRKNTGQVKQRPEEGSAFDIPV